ncbi:PLP-dependent aminotransferase family protein [Paenibacillus rigui]|uniref:GntR family transcriptional regulator n=1 Tax=Paenibacillus rigui TaxID=554312 RepID=A0A229UJW2_9BACL|nr:PLP-dependent aminotransferase family protein [Paenibacillus rigui]OXM83738.1 GntR family transcriptional regulator [Paenibacillus rigui]
MHKYLHVLTDLEAAIESPPYRDGSKLPSVRSLTAQYGCSKSTILRALDELERQHLIYSIPKSGYYVVKKSAAPKQRAEAFLDFVTSAPDPDIFPYLDFQHCINKAIDTYKEELFVYGTPKGLPSLIQEVQKHLADDQVFADTRSIFIVSGVQQALSLLSTMPFPNGKTRILVEQPSYHLFIEQLETHGLPCIGIERTAKGIDLEELERIFRTGKIKLFYTMPRFHSPLGCSYTREQKKNIAALCRAYDVYAVEDDYLADFEQDPKVDPLYAYDDSFSHVIYLKSYSKIMFPGLRIGIAVIPDALSETFHKHKKLVDIDSSMLSQGALEIYLKSGMFERHKQKISASYARRGRILHEAVQEQALLSGGLFRNDPDATRRLGVHTHMLLDAKVPVSRVIRQLKKLSIAVEPADKHYLTDFPKKASILKLNVSHVQEGAIAEGIARLADTIRRAVR